MKMKLIWNSKKFDNEALDETLKQLKELDVEVVIDKVPIGWFRDKKFKVERSYCTSGIIFLYYEYSDTIKVYSKIFSIGKKLKKWIKKGLELE